MPWRSPDRVGVRRVYFTSRVIETSPSPPDDAGQRRRRGRGAGCARLRAARDHRTAAAAEGVTEYVVAAPLAVGGGWAGGHGARLLVRAVCRADDPASSLRAVRGIRGVVI